MPQKVDAATKVYQTVIPEELQYTEAQWNNNNYEARPSAARAKLEMLHSKPPQS